MKILTTLLLSTTLTASALANPQDTIVVQQDTIVVDYEMPDTMGVDEAFDANIDSTMNLYYVEQSLEEIDSAEVLPEDFIPKFSDSVYIDRLSKIPSVASLDYNNVVKRYIDVYTVKKRKQVSIMLGMSEHYFPVFDDIFDYYDVPNELKYMSIIESGLNPRAYSRARAVGLWQFMYGTGKMYGLEINSLVDERRDPIKSTHAAARYIGRLNSMYDDWLLAIAAYNCGPGNVNKAIRRAGGGKKTFWQIYPYLPRETRGHVPAFIAATYTMNYYKEHNIIPTEIDMPLEADTIMINQKLHLKQVAEVMDLPVQQLRDLNPQYRYDIIPGQVKAYPLRLPFEQTTAFIELEDSIYNYKDSIFFSQAQAKIAKSSSYVPQAPGADYVKLTYTVKSGDAVGLIAAWYKVRTTDLRYWNNIRRNMIRSGQRLSIYKHKSVANNFKDINRLSYAEKQARIGKTVSTTTPAPLPDLEDGNYTLYTVKSGDTLWDIAKLFDGVSDTDIMRWNNISNAGSIKPGQKLRIRKIE